MASGRIPDSLAYPPMGLGREDAARYVGIGTTKFDEMVKDGRMPRPRRIDNRRVWLRTMLDAALASLPEEGGSAGNPIDAILRGHPSAA